MDFGGAIFFTDYVARLVFNLPPAKADEVLPLLDRCEALMHQALA